MDAKNSKNPGNVESGRKSGSGKRSGNIVCNTWNIFGLEKISNENVSKLTMHLSAKCHFCIIKAECKFLKLYMKFGVQFFEQLRNFSILYVMSDFDPPYWQSYTIYVDMYDFSCNECNKRKY